MEGEGVVSIGIEPLQLVSGAYAVEARLYGAIAGVTLAIAQSGWLYTRGPSLGHEPASGVFIPALKWVSNSAEE
jgi:hypothetical protein